MFQPLIEYWHKHKCPKCLSINWTYHSHSQRVEPMSNPDICQCWNCSNRYWLMGEETAEDLFQCDESYAQSDIGRVRPN